MTGIDPSTVLCRTCAVEHTDRAPRCEICTDERQYVPATGQLWTTLGELRAEGTRARVTELEPDLFGVSAAPAVGIGQVTKLVRTPGGILLWDPLGYVDDEVAAAVRAVGPVTAIVASHPHMFGVQVEWSRALGGAPVYVAAADRAWVRRPDSVIRPWTGPLEVLPGVTLSQPGGHFPGSAIAHWAAGAGGRGVLLTGDTVLPNPDRATVSFMRSYPNHIPLSPAVVRRVADHLDAYAFDRLHGIRGSIVRDARTVVRESARRHIGWASGEFDHLT